MTRRASSRDRLVDVQCYLHHVTEKAYLVSLYDDREVAVWVPKSASEWEPGQVNTNAGTLTLSEALATDKGLV